MATATANSLSSEEHVILSMFHGMWQNRCICLIVEFKIPEMLCNAKEPLSIDDIATKTGCTSSKQLYTIMRVLAQWGIGKELDNKCFIKNRAMELLRRDKDPSLGDLIAYFCSDENFTAMRSLPKSVREDRPAFVLEHGMTHLDYMNEFEQPYKTEKRFEGSSAANLVGSDGRRLELAMTYQRSNEILSKLETSPDGIDINTTIHKVFPWQSCSKIVDVGGGTGFFLASILKEPGCEHIKGYVIDLPHVVGKAQEHFHDLEIPKHRLQFIKHDMTKLFSSDLKLEADTILFKNVIGMFLEDKERTVQFLQNSLSLSSPKGGRILIIEPCGPSAGDTEHNVGENGLQHGFQSIHWINICGGRYRSKDELSELLRSFSQDLDGLTLSQRYDTFLGGYSIFEFSIVSS